MCDEIVKIVDAGQQGKQFFVAAAGKKNLEIGPGGGAFSYDSFKDHPAKKPPAAFAAGIFSKNNALTPLKSVRAFLYLTYSITTRRLGSVPTE